MDEQKNRHITLQLILTQGKGMMVGEIKAANKQEVHTPMNFQDMTEQLRMFTIANNIFLGKLSVGSQCLRTLQTMIDCNRSTFKARERLDEQFYSKFFFAIDLRFQIWLKQCQSARNCNKVDGNTIDFMPVVLQVLFGYFHINPPPTFQRKDPTVAIAAATAKISASNKKDSSGNEEGKRTKKKKNKDRAMVKNKAPHPELCMLSTETWAINFASKHANKRPKWNKTCHCCPCWFLQKYCFLDCKNKDSHVKANKIPTENLTNMKAWIKLCRSGN
jgi:hypothetical protein